MDMVLDFWDWACALHVSGSEKTDYGKALSRKGCERRKLDF